ncbi:Uncharacterised protein [Mycobacteroides abscessus subsp. abscessus]|nr:Uncharacterised protein [Mycobacteroides abscessus subsp. abscessus]
MAAWNERIVLGSRLFEDIASDPAPRRALRTLLVGHSHDPDLLRIATQLSQAGAAVEVFLVDRVSRLPTLELSATGHGRHLGPSSSFIFISTALFDATTTGAQSIPVLRVTQPASRDV